MIAVWKYKVDFVFGRAVEINPPSGAEFLHLAIQDGTPHIWLKVKTTNRLYPRRFEWHATGLPIKRERNLKYMGTVITEEAEVFHLFENIAAIIPIQSE